MLENSSSLKISVIICTYNRCEKLKETLDSILNQECEGSFDYEIIIVDNNSNDKTKETVEDYIPRFNNKLRYLFEPRQGKSYALNTGIEDAKGEIIAFTDDDVITDKKWLKNIAKIFSQKDVDLLGGKVIPFFPIEPPGWLRNYSNNRLKYPLMQYDLGNKYLESGGKNKILPIGANLIIKKMSYYKFGGYLYHGRTQDIEFSNRWHSLGAKIAYSPDVIVYHYTHPHRLNKSYFRKYYFQTGRGHAIIFKEDYSGGRLLFGVPLWLYGELYSAVKKFLKNTFGAQINSFSDELMIYYKLGIISAKHNFRFNYDNLR